MRHCHSACPRTRGFLVTKVRNPHGLYSSKSCVIFRLTTYRAGAGFVKSVGPKVTKVQEGDRVLLSFSFCKECHNCQFGAPGFCQKWGQINFSGTKGAFSSSESETHGEEIGGSFFGQSSFSRLTRVKECSVVKVTDLLKNDDQLKVLAPFGCGIQTGAGTITELANAQAADTVAILGLGAVGLAAIMVCSLRHVPHQARKFLSSIQGAKIRGCKTIIGVDRIASRLELAKSLGATHVVDTGSIEGTLGEEVRGITGGVGTTVTVDASGAVPLIQQGVEFTANQGKAILLGVPPMDAALQVHLVPYIMVRTIIHWLSKYSLTLVQSGKSVQGSMEGGVFPEQVWLSQN